jgi:hypothetical protein
MVRSDNTDQLLALIAEEIGAEVIPGPVRYPSDSGDIEVGGVDIGEYLYELRDQEVMLIIVPIGPVDELPLVCGLCGTPYQDDACPTCRQEREDAKRLTEDVEEWLGTHCED